jgi:DNA replication protein DnaD
MIPFHALEDKNCINLVPIAATQDATQSASNVRCIPRIKCDYYTTNTGYIYNNGDGGNNMPTAATQNVLNTGIAQTALDHFRQYYEQQIMPLSNTACAEIQGFLDKGLEVGLLFKAVDIAIDNGVPKWPFVKAVLERFVTGGIKDIAAFEAHEAQRRQGKQSANDEWGDWDDAHGTFYGKKLSRQFEPGL